MNSKLKGMVMTSQIGWFGIRHKDGWWVGNDIGAITYARRDLAQAALTIIWQRDGGKQLDYRIAIFDGADVNVGEHTPQFSTTEALKRYSTKKAWEV